MKHFWQLKTSQAFSVKTCTLKPIHVHLKCWGTKFLPLEMKTAKMYVYTLGGANDTTKEIRFHSFLNVSAITRARRTIFEICTWISKLSVFAVVFSFQTKLTSRCDFEAIKAQTWVDKLCVIVKTNFGSRSSCVSDVVFIANPKQTLRKGSKSPSEQRPGGHDDVCNAVMANFLGGRSQASHKHALKCKIHLEFPSTPKFSLIHTTVLTTEWPFTKR